MPTDKYIVECGPTQVSTAFTAIARLCADKGITNVTLVIPKKGGWESTIIAAFLGPTAVKALSKGSPVITTSGVRMTMESAQNFRPHASHGLLIGAHISERDMNKLEDSFA